jgi:hypothetical protein
LNRCFLNKTYQWLKDTRKMLNFNKQQMQIKITMKQYPTLVSLVITRKKVCVREVVEKRDPVYISGNVS